MEVEYAAIYRDLYERHWWWRAREGLVLDLIARYCPPGGFGSILDVGCGDGLFFNRLAEFGRVEGVESDASIVTERGRSCGAIHVMPFERYATSNRYGLIVMLDVLEHLDDDLPALQQALRLLGDDGIVVVTVPAIPALRTSHDDLNHHRRRYTRASLCQVIEEAGLRPELIRYTYQVLAAAKLAVRLGEGLFGPPPRGLHGIPRPSVNRLLEGLMTFELRVARWLRMPIGSSLVAVLRRGDVGQWGTTRSDRPGR